MDEKIHDHDSEQEPMISAVIRTDERQDFIHIKASTLYAHVQHAINKILAFDGKPGENNILAMTVRTAVKGVLLMYGERIVKLQWVGSGPAPHPGKHDDLIAWYSAFFTSNIIADLTQHQIILTGSKPDEAYDDIFIESIQVHKHGKHD